ncbi:hypothetical protein BL253_09320 [Pseudofrankia asymbiotica]|uniref:Protein kinase domain-containing protein n=1 Tax=Pseudofrankia asymbiotica TaxID=1834516 RepID=A0A1V2IEJ2_9ACTN|nr:hypothetical protein BL253_09320 [Pseudofrankia asymbiotica]
MPRANRSGRGRPALRDQYDVLGLLGTGGMGTVHRVRHRAWNIDLAMKSPRPELLSDASKRESFVREAETWVSLDLHPHVVTCHYVQTFDDTPRIFVELVDGGSLHDRIQDGTLYRGGADEALARLLDTAIQFCWGLDAAHRRGLVHQDVKPGNVMLTADGIVKVTDFGLAKALSEVGPQTSDPLVPVPAPFGLVSVAGLTPAFCSPEQAARLPLDPRTDVWSWAASVLLMFTGRRTWAYGPLAGQALETCLRAAPADRGRPAGAGAPGRGRAPVGQPPAIPDGLGDVLGRCLRDDPAERPESMAEVAQLLLTVYQRELGRPCPHEPYAPVRGMADDLNNRALSFLELGRDDEAAAAWRQALDADPRHAATLYNFGVYRWRRGEVTDEMLLQQLATAAPGDADDWLPDFLRARVHLERRDRRNARVALARVSDQAEETRAPAVRAAVAELEERVEEAGDFRRVRTVDRQAFVEAMAVSGDGARTVVALRADGPDADSTWLVVEETRSGREVARIPALGHGGRVTAVAADRAATLAVTGSEDATARLWDLRGEALRQTVEPGGQVQDLWLSPDGERLLTATDRTLAAFDLTERRRLWVSPGSDVSFVAFSADGSLVGSGGYEQIALWDGRTGRCLTELDHGSDAFRGFGLSGDGRWLLAARASGRLSVWDVGERDWSHAFAGSGRELRNVLLDPTGRHALTNSHRDRVRLWDVPAGRCLRTFDALRLSDSFAVWTPDGRHVLFHGSRSTAVWECRARDVTSPYWPSRVRPGAPAVARRARSLTDRADAAWQLGDVAGTLAVVRRLRALPGHANLPETDEAWRKLGLRCEPVTIIGARLLRVLDHFQSWIQDLSLHGSGLWGHAVSGDGEVVRWDLERGEVTAQHRLTGSYLARIEPSGEQLTSATYQGDYTRVALSARAGERRFQETAGHAGPGAPLDLALSRDGRFGAAVSLDVIPGMAREGGAERRLVWLRAEMQPWVRAVLDELDAERPRGGAVLVWHHATGARVRRYLVDRGPRAVALSADGRLAAAAGDEALWLWDNATGRSLWSLRMARARFRQVELSADGRWLLAADHADLVLLDTVARRVVRRSAGHGAEVRALAMAEDGRIAVSADQDGEVRVWDPRDGQCLWSLRGPTEVTALTLSEDRRRLLVGYGDGGLHLWAFDWDLAPPDPARGAEVVRPDLEQFVALHTAAGWDPRPGAAYPRHPEPSSSGNLTDEQVRALFTRHGRAAYTEIDVRNLLTRLSRAGFGWIAPDAVHRLLREVTETAATGLAGNDYVC